MLLQTCLLDEFHPFVCYARDLFSVTICNILLCVIQFSCRSTWGNKAVMFSLLQAASKARERNPGKDHRYIFNRFLFSSWCLLVNLVDLRKFRIMCFFSRKIEQSLANLMVSRCNAAGPQF